MNKHSLIISKLINGGSGLGQLADGRVAMVRYVLPGEQVEIAAMEEKKSYLLGRLLTVSEPSKSRITPPCPYFGSCGGCDLQHGSYEEQLRVKREIVVDLLARQPGGATGADLPCPVEATLPSPVTTGYRQRVRLWVKDHAVFAFRKYHSHDLVAIKRCLIAREEINEALAALAASPDCSRLLAHSLEVELLWNPASTKVTALFHLARKPRPADFAGAGKLTQSIPILERVFFAGEQFPLTAAAPAGCDNRMSVRYEAITGRGLTPLVISWEVGGFCQVNLEQNLSLIRLVCEFAAVEQHESVLDLFCGSGNFSIPLAAMARSLVGIEGQGAAIRGAKANCLAMGLTNTTFFKRPIHAACEELTGAGERFDCLVIDPPRQGIPGLAKQLHALCQSRLVYISCDPATLVRDLADLRQAGFTVTRIQPVDMFPQTHHIETVVLLEKN